jgi:hypothetical protein
MMNHESLSMVGGRRVVDHRRGGAGRAWRATPWAIGLLLALLSLASTAATANPEYEVVPSPYPILDSDFLVSDRNETFWLDDYRVLFVGSHKKKPATRDEPRIGHFGIYIWDTRNSTVSMYREKVYGHLCYEDGWIHYTDSLARPYRFAAGPMGKEQLTTLATKEEERQFFAKYFFSKTTCRHHERTRFAPGEKRGWHVIPLGSSGNYLTTEVRLRGEVGKTLFFGAGENKGQRMPFNFDDFVVTRIKHFTFKKKYFIETRFGDWVRREKWFKDNCAPAWWLGAGGNAEHFCIPSGPWYAPASILLSPLRDGMAVVSHRVLDDRPSAGGLYFVNDNNHMKLVDGWVRSPSTSPSGCKLAFTHAPDHDAQAYGRGHGKTVLKMIDFCVRNQ